MRSPSADLSSKCLQILANVSHGEHYSFIQLVHGSPCSLLYYIAELLKRCIYSFIEQFYALIRGVVTFKFHRPPGMSVTPPVQAEASFYLANHPLFDKTIDSTLFCSYNEMHFKYYAF